MSETFVPDTIEGVSQLLVSREWDKAAVVWAYVHCTDERGNKRQGANAKNSICEKPYTPESFAAKGFTGLRSKDTVRAHWKRWQDAIKTPGSGACPIKPGDPIPTVTLSWKEKAVAPKQEAPKKDRPAQSRDPELLNKIRERRAVDEPTRDLAKEFGITGGTLSAAENYVIGEENAIATAAPIAWESLGPTAAKRADEAKRRIQKQLDKEYAEKVAAETARLKVEAGKAVEDHKAQLLADAVKEREARDAERKRYKTACDVFRANGVMVESDYKTILACLHPDNSASTEKRAEAFRLFRDERIKAALLMGPGQ